MHPLHIKDRSDGYELTQQDGRSWKRPLFILLCGFLLGITASLLFVLSSIDLLAGISAFISISFDVVAFVMLVSRERTQGRSFFVKCIFLLLILLTFPLLEGLSFPLLWLGGGALLFLVLFLVTYAGAASSDKRTRMSIGAFTIALSEDGITVGSPCTISYQLSFKQATRIKTLQITFSYQQYTGQESSGMDAYTARSVPLHQKDNFSGEQGDSLIEEFQLTIPENLNSLRRERRAWSLDVLIKPDKASTLLASYPLRVIPKLPIEDTVPHTIVIPEWQEIIDRERQALEGGEGQLSSDGEAMENVEWQPLSDGE